MATQTATLPARSIPASAGMVLPAFTLWWRELVRFYRQRSRVIGVIASPLVFWVVLGSGFGSSFRSGSAQGQQQKMICWRHTTSVLFVLCSTENFGNQYQNSGPSKNGAVRETACFSEWATLDSNQ